MADIFLQGLTKVYDNGVRALVDLDLAVADGECLVLVGPSGCGKTTALRLIAGLEEPTSGSVRIGGRSMDRVPPARRQVAMVFQKPVLLANQTVRSNLNWGNRLRRGLWRSLVDGVAPAKNGAVGEMAALLGLTEVLDRRAGELSGGQVQRVALGRALLRETDVQLLDEPLGNLDVPLRRHLRQELHLLRQRIPATMIYVTHDPEEATALGQRIAVLHEGVLRQVDRPEHLQRRPRHRFVAELFHPGPGPMNFVPGELHAKDGGLDFRSEVMEVRFFQGPECWQKKLGRPAFLGVRAEELRIQWIPTNLSAWEVVLVESCDRGKLVTCSRETGRVTVLAEEAEEIAVGSRVGIELRSESNREGLPLLFDAGSGKNFDETG